MIISRKSTSEFEAAYFVYRTPTISGPDYSSQFLRNGHHIHATIRPEFQEREEVADRWQVKLETIYYRKERPYMALSEDRRPVWDRSPA
jgi:hypothetical protein